eukprot:5093010-Pleurochrysis_carterae.AAC.1
MGPELKDRPTEGRLRAVVKEISRFDAAEGAVRLPQERTDAFENGGARGRPRRVCKSRSCGDGECVSYWQTS